MKKSNLNETWKEVSPKTPSENAVSHFIDNYSALNGLNHGEIIVKYDANMRAIFTMDGIDPEFHGLIFHYGFDSSPNVNRITYLIGLGKLDENNNVVPFPFPTANPSVGKYYEVESGEPEILERNETHFNSRVQDYYCQVTRKSQVTELFQPIRHIPNHARMAFHPKSELTDFDKEYEIATGQRYLYFYNGSRDNRAHAPILMFGDGSPNPYYMDDEDYRTNYGNGARYRNKAFNIGILCPPNCAVASPICPSPEDE